MLTMEALEERAWQGLTALRRFLGEKRQDFENSFYPTSISDAEFDHYRRFAVLAALVKAERETLLRRVLAESHGRARNDAIQATITDLDHLIGALSSLSARLDSLARDVQTVRGQILTSR